MKECHLPINDARGVTLQGVVGEDSELATVLDQVWEPIEAALSDERWAVLLRFNQRIPAAAMLQYGAGYYPALNLRDEWGIPLPLFGPILVP